MSARRNNIWVNLDWFTIGLYFLLVFLGWINIYSAVYSEDQVQTFDFSLRYGRQLIWIAASLIIILIAMVVDSKFYSSFAFVIYGIVMFLLLAVLLVGTEINGARSWLVLGPIRLQPSEFAKFASALALAKYLSTYGLKPEKFKTFLIFCAIVFFPSILILLQNDTGSALVFAVLFLVYYREGMPSVYLIIGLLAVVLFVLSLLYQNYIIIILIELVALLVFYLLIRKKKETLVAALVLFFVSFVLWYLGAIFKPSISKNIILITALIITSVWYLVKIYKHKLREGYFILFVLFMSIAYTFSVNYVFGNVLDDYQQRRIKVLLGMESDPYGAGYNVNQSMIAIGSGGAVGKGYLQGTQTKFKFVPEQSTDFIFCTVGEEWGFMGTTLILALFLVLLLRLIFLAERQKSVFSRAFGYSVACIIFFHVAVNVGMTIGLAPVIGIPLPFFSYGGSSLWGFTFLLFIFLKLDSNRTQLIN
ncbi:MAG: rod shape-determining protein RodA [Salinivirgaceae bacterium]|nr:rod shape-determining protein RodA [Salinivirgaceae bacterium]